MRDDWEKEIVWIQTKHGKTILAGRTFLIRAELRAAGYTYHGETQTWWSRHAGPDFTFQLVKRTGIRTIVLGDNGIANDTHRGPAPPPPDFPRYFGTLSGAAQQPRTRADIQADLAKLRAELDSLDKLQDIPKRRLRAK